MPEYIEREAVEKILENAQLISDVEYCGYCTYDIDIAKIPAADVEPVRHGRVLIHQGHEDDYYEFCSLCKSKDVHVGDNYCSNCGAKMDLKENNIDECTKLEEYPMEAIRLKYKQQAAEGKKEWKINGGLIECQCCGEIYSIIYNEWKAWNYCPSCGERMDLEE